ncbi:MAG TPA: CdaR family protein [Thermomicrobiales bacterium]|nr:CdaR family protein [Thermomicrobiales bacterium]
MIDRLKRFADTGNAVRFFLSFILAFALWAWVTNERDPEQTYRASQVPVSAVGIPENLEIVGAVPAVDVTLQGPRSVIQTIDAASLTAEVNLDDVDGPGSYDRKVHVNAPDGIRTITTDPETITVELDTVVSKTFPVEALPPAEIPRSLTVTSISVEPQQVTVTGVQSNVDQVARVLAPINIGDNTDSFSDLISLSAVDQNNVEVENVEIEPGAVRVRVDLEVRGKEIPVFVQCECDDVAEGFVVVGQPQANPANVIIDGDPEVLAQVPYIYTTPVNTSGLDQTTVIDGVPLDIASLPDGVTVDPQFVDVSVRVEQTQFTRTLENIPIEVLGTEPNTRVVVNPATLSIDISGPRDKLDQLEPRDVAVVVDVTGLDVGAHQVRPRVALPAGMTYSDALPQVVVAIIDTSPTATSTARPAPTSAPEPTPTPNP